MLSQSPEHKACTTISISGKDIALLQLQRMSIDKMKEEMDNAEKVLQQKASAYQDALDSFHQASWVKIDSSMQEIKFSLPESAMKIANALHRLIKFMSAFELGIVEGSFSVLTQDCVSVKYPCKIDWEWDTPRHQIPRLFEKWGLNILTDGYNQKRYIDLTPEQLFKVVDVQMPEWIKESVRRSQQQPLSSSVAASQTSFFSSSSSSTLSSNENMKESSCSIM